MSRLIQSIFTCILLLSVFFFFSIVPALPNRGHRRAPRADFSDVADSAAGNLAVRKLLPCPQ